MAARKQPSKNSSTFSSQEVGALLESLRNDIRLIAESQRGLRADVDGVKLSLIPLEGMRSEFATFKGAILEMTKDMKTLKADLAELKTAVDHRLTAVEAKAGL